MVECCREFDAPATVSSAIIFFTSKRRVICNNTETHNLVQELRGSSLSAVSPHRKTELRYKLVTCAVEGSKMHRVRRVILQFLPQLEDMVVHGPSRRIILVAPNLIQKFFTRNDAFRILYHEFQGLKLLGRE